MGGVCGEYLCTLLCGGLRSFIVEKVILLAIWFLGGPV